MMRKAMIFMGLCLLSACGGRQAVVPDPLPQAPILVEVDVPHYVPVPDWLLQPCQWRRAAPLAVIPEVARERRKCLEKYEADRAAIRKIRGGPVIEENP